MEADNETSTCTIYHGLDSADTIEGVAQLNAPLSGLKLPNVSISLPFPENKPQIVRRTKMHKWWDFEVMACMFNGILKSEISPDCRVELFHFNPKAISWLRQLGGSGTVRVYEGLKYLDFPILKTRTATGYWNEEFNDDTRIILTDAEIPEGDTVQAYCATLDALRDYVLNTENDQLARDLAECTMLEFLLDGTKMHHELAQYMGVSTRSAVITDIMAASKEVGWIKTIANIRNVFEEPEDLQILDHVKRASGARTGQRASVLQKVIHSEWYECADAIVSLMKCRATVRANELLVRRMPNAMRGNQWVSCYFNCDLMDEMPFELWVRMCGFASEMSEFFTSDMSEYLVGSHLATDTSNMRPYRGRSYTYRGLTISKARQYEYMDSEPPMSLKLPPRSQSKYGTNHDEQLSLCVNARNGELIVVSTRLCDRLMRFISTISVSFSFPIVSVSRDGKRIVEGSDGPGPNALAGRVLRGEYENEALMWLLSHIFAGNIAVKKQSPVRCFIPRHALSDQGLVIQEPLPAGVLQTFKVIKKQARSGEEFYWVPKRIGNIFQIEVGKTLVSLKETEEDIVDDSFEVVRLASYKKIG